MSLARTSRTTKFPNLRSRTTKAITDSNAVVFPRILQEVIAFDDLESLKQLIQQECAVRSIGMYFSDVLTYRVTDQTIQVRCLICRSRFGLVRHKGKWVVKMAELYHTNMQEHVQYSKPHEATIIKERKRRPRKLRETTECQPMEKMKQSDLSSLDTTQTEKDTHESVEKQPQMVEVPAIKLMDWLVANDYQFRVEWGDGPRNSFPARLLAVSPAMKQAYSSFGRLISFDILPNLLLDEKENGRYKAGIISTIDGDGRFLICGVVIFTNDTAQQVARMFTDFIEMNGNIWPLTIVTQQQSPVIKAFDILDRQDLFTGDHLLSPKAVVAKLANLMVDSYSKLDAMMAINLLIKALSSKNRKEYHDLSEKIRVISKSNIQVDRLFEECWSSFYTLSGKAFVGLCFDYSKRLEIIGERHLGVNCTINQLFKKLKELEVQASYPVLQSTEANLLLTTNPGLCWALKGYGHEAKKQLIGNFLKALSILKKPENEEVIEQDTSFPCQCFSMERTGVACEHQVKNAIFEVNGDGQYNLISDIWRKADSSTLQMSQNPRGC